jgi:REP element-mobilizing transposase RayT
MQLEHDLVRMPKTEMELERRKAIEQWLDSGMGACLLAHPALAQLVQDTLLRFDGERYRLIAWCVMPNHVHMLIEPMIPLSPIVQSWKSYTGREGRKTAAELGLGAPGLASGRFWMREFWDRFIRNDEHLQQVIRFIHENPVKAGLCAAPAEWRWSSAHPPLGAPSPSSAH